MDGFHRGAVSVTVEIDVTAGEYWEMLRDWPAVMKWNNGDGPGSLSKVTLKEGHDVNILPCSRVMYPYPYNESSPTTEETLLYADPESRRLIYTFSGALGGLCNYIATTYVDELNGGRARITCASMFDLPARRSLEKTIKWLEYVYEHTIIRGIEAAIQRERQARSIKVV